MSPSVLFITNSVLIHPRYFSLTVKDKKYDNLIWYYQYPTHESAGVSGLISFYNKDGVDILVDGVKI